MEHFRSLFKHVPAFGHCSFLHMVGLYCGHATQAGMDWEPEVSGFGCSECDWVLSLLVRLFTNHWMK